MASFDQFSQTTELTFDEGVDSETWNGSRGFLFSNESVLNLSNSSIISLNESNLVRITIHEAPLGNSYYNEITLTPGSIRDVYGNEVWQNQTVPIQHLVQFYFQVLNATMNIESGQITIKCNGMVNESSLDLMLVSIGVNGSDPIPIGNTTSHLQNQSAVHEDLVLLTLSDHQKSSIMDAMGIEMKPVLLSITSGAFFDVNGAPVEGVQNMNMMIQTPVSAHPPMLNDAFLRLGDLTLILNVSEYVPQVNVEEIQLMGVGLVPEMCNVSSRFDGTVEIALFDTHIRDIIVLRPSGNPVELLLGQKGYWTPPSTLWHRETRHIMPAIRKQSRSITYLLKTLVRRVSILIITIYYGYQ